LYIPFHFMLILCFTYAKARFLVLSKWLWLLLIDCPVTSSLFIYASFLCRKTHSRCVVCLQFIALLTVAVLFLSAIFGQASGATTYGRRLEAYGTDRRLEAYGTGRRLEAYGTGRRLEAYGTGRRLEAYGTGRRLEAYGTGRRLEAYGTGRRLEAYGTGRRLESAEEVQRLF
jgi:hypothetical protein